jgi:hypothetical protein
MNINEARGGTFCLSKAGLSIGSTASKVAIAAPNGAGVDYAIEGTLYHKADTADIAITAATAQAASTTCLYLVCLDASGDLTTEKGTEVTTTDMTNGNSVLHWPNPTEDSCPIGALKVVTSSSATFTAGTTNLNATGVTTTYIDLMTVPVAPKTS